MPKKKKVHQKLYNFHLSFPVSDAFNIEQYANSIKTLRYIKDFAIVIHDKDVDSEDNPLCKHAHVICYPDNNYTIKKYAKDFNVPEDSILKNEYRFKRALIGLMQFNDTLEHRYDCNKELSSQSFEVAELIKFIIRHEINTKELSEVFNND